MSRRGGRAESKLFRDALAGASDLPTKDEADACEVARDMVLEGRLDDARAALAQAPNRLAQKCPVCGSMAGEDCVEITHTFGGLPLINKWLLIPHHARLVGRLDAGPLFAEPSRPICTDCNNEIDPNTCHCGEDADAHNHGSGHSPVPLGCMCHLADHAPLDGENGA